MHISRMNYKIIKLDPKEFDKCGNIWNMTNNPERTKKRYEGIKSGNQIAFVYVENGNFIGDGVLILDNGDRDYTIPDKRVCIQRMAVKKERRNQGIGGIILDFLIDEAKRMGYKEITLGVNKSNTAARYLYEKKRFDTVLFDGADEYGEYVKLLKYLTN